MWNSVRYWRIPKWLYRWKSVWFWRILDWPVPLCEVRFDSNEYSNLFYSEIMFWFDEYSKLERVVVISLKSLPGIWLPPSNTLLLLLLLLLTPHKPDLSNPWSQSARSIPSIPKRKSDYHPNKRLSVQMVRLSYTKLSMLLEKPDPPILSLLPVGTSKQNGWQRLCVDRMLSVILDAIGFIWAKSSP